MAVDLSSDGRRVLSMLDKVNVSDFLLATGEDDAVAVVDAQRRQIGRAHV